MANELMANDASFGFLPWVRRGLASLAKNTPAQNFVTLQVELTVNATPTSPPTPPVSVRLHGPGQVTGIDARAIIRTDPRPHTGSFEPSFFPTVEFATPDFPWLFTPALPAGDQLRPWLCLAVIRDQPGVALIARPRALSLLQFNAPAAPLDELPNLDQIAIWAHAQVVGDAQADLLSYLSGPASRRLSRIICPRKLEPQTRYLACLVPTYHAGVQVGIAPDLPVDDHDLAPAWDSATQAPFALPVYWSWRFGTSSEGDFASLVRKLHPDAGLQVGQRPMDVSAPGFGMPEFPGLSLGLEGALRSSRPAASDPAADPWPVGVQTQFEAALRPILSPPPAADPIIAPPVYGQAAADSPLQPSQGTPPLWLRELNLDPRNRVAAGIGADIVRADQEELLASAWDQFEALRRANQLLRQLQLARSVLRITLTRQVATVDGPGTLLQLTRPLHARVRLDLASNA